MADAATAERPLLLEVSSVKAGYGRRPVLHGVDLHVAGGEVVAVFGHNGAGKTTLLKTIVGSVSASEGRISYAGSAVTSRSAVQNAKSGVMFIPAEHFVFGELAVYENLRLGAHRDRSKRHVEQRLQRVYEIFPILAERRGQAAETMSGGEQRMLSIGIALMSEPRLLLLDEPSLGLAPALVEQTMAVVARLAREEDLSVLLVEQNVPQTLRVVDRAYFLRAGEIIFEERAEKLHERSHYWDLF